MSDTSDFLVLSSASTLLIATGVLAIQSEKAARTSARTFYWLCIVLSSITLLVTVLDATSVLSIDGASQWWFKLLVYRAWVVIGTAVSCALLLVLSRSHKLTSIGAKLSTSSFLHSSDVLKGICISVSMSFLCTEVGKVAHDAEMRQFFIQSGYPVWLLYLTMTLEILGAIGLLLEKWLKIASIGLAVIMLGAIATHLHNRDPFADSLEALHLLILLVCVLTIKHSAATGVG